MIELHSESQLRPRSHAERGNERRCCSPGQLDKRQSYPSRTGGEFRFAAVLQISEVRTIAADDLWMSTAFGRASVAFHFTWLPDWGAVRRVLPDIENALAPFDPRPHWGKVFTMSPEAIRSSYEKLPLFAALLERHDPTGKFRNAFLTRYIFAE